MPISVTYCRATGTLWVNSGTSKRSQFSEGTGRVEDEDEIWTDVSKKSFEGGVLVWST